MCGILGGNIIEWDYKDGIQSMSHRGPDGEKTVRYGEVTLSFVRLAIQDLSERAMQPMVSEDESIVIIFNGEIYGYKNLKNQLKAKYHFRTTSDTEVILHAYEEYGDKFIDLIDGMYAIAIYDKRQQQIKLYRDRAGIKPLYYYETDGKFAFASELKALVAAGKQEKWVYDETALFDFIHYQYIPEPKSMYRNVYKLPPAYQLVYDLRKKQIVTKERYWRLRVNSSQQRHRKAADLEEQLRDLIRQSVCEQMVADVPVGTFLSGGIDSSIVTYESLKQDANIKAFNIGLPDKKYDESCYANRMAEQYGIRLKSDIISIAEFQRIKGNMRQWYDEPFADDSSYLTYLVSKRAREEVVVVLTGDGGDELFGGYDRYQKFLDSGLPGQRKWKHYDIEKVKEKLSRWRCIPEEIREKYFLPEIFFYARLIGIRQEEAYEHFKTAWKLRHNYDTLWLFRKYNNRELPPLTRMRYLDFKTYLPGAILTKVDRASMAVSLETRVPLLSRKIIEFAFSLSEEECCPKGNLKGILKDAYKDILPTQILERKKRGFSAPPRYFGREDKEPSRFIGILKNEWRDLYEWRKE